MFYLRSPWKQTILLMLMASVIVAGSPQTAFADAPAYDPVFYYYHTDHLGSSTVLTNRDGELVQHYGYTAFGYEQYKENTSAFSVTNRYTGQQLDEDTGLYFYKSRYYDPQLARFTQADSVVPSSNTSQALNRYSYVKNNPLKFTDPSGHGWFSDIFKKIGEFFKKYIGTILTVLLTPGLGIFYASLIGSAVATAVNGGTFASFAVGVGIGIAAGYVAGSAGDGLFGAGWAEGATAANAAWQDAALYGAMAGATGGAISSIVYGQNIEKGLAYGAIGSLAGMVVAAVTSAAISFGASVVKEIGKTVVNNSVRLAISAFRLAGKVAIGIIDAVDFVVDDIVSHFRTAFWVKGQNGTVLPIKVFRSRSFNGLMTKIGSFAMNIGGEIHIGPEMAEELLIQESYRQDIGETLKNNPVKYWWHLDGERRGNWAEEIMAHELGHQVDADKFGPGLYQLIGAISTHNRYSDFECNASERGEYYGITLK